MATGVPCIAPCINGIPELIRNEVDGLLFTASDVGELVAVIERMIDDPAMRRRMAESSRVRVAAKYDLLKNVDHLSDLLRDWMSRV